MCERAFSLTLRQKTTNVIAWSLYHATLFAPKTIRSRQRKFQVWNFRSLELSFPPMNTTRSESSNKCVDLHVGNFRCYTLWTIIIETSHLNVTKRLPISQPNIFGFAITQRLSDVYFLPLFVNLGVYRSGAWQISRPSYLLDLSAASEVPFDCGRPTFLFSAHLGLYVLLNSATSYR